MATTISSSSTAPKTQKKVTTHDFRVKKQRGERITMLTAYDYATALALDQVGIDAILVGDSLGMVVLGYENTLPVTMEDMLHHCKAVARGARRAFLVGDMPFMSYQVSVEKAVENAGRFLQESGMDAVKLEGGRERLEAVRSIVSTGIPVMGHLGLTPQSIYKFGTYQVRAKEEAEAEKLKKDALILQEAGCFAIVLEKIPAELAKEVSESLSIPTIGIGAGGDCDGQVLVMHDMLGINHEFKPRFLRQYMNLYTDITNAVRQYIEDVKKGDFPNDKEQY